VHPHGLSARMVPMMVFSAALLANGVARTRSADFTVDLATKSAMCVFSCHWCDHTESAGVNRNRDVLVSGGEEKCISDINAFFYAYEK